MEHNNKTINMYNSGGACEYIAKNDIEPEKMGKII